MSKNQTFWSVEIVQNTVERKVLGQHDILEIKTCTFIGVLPRQTAITSVFLEYQDDTPSERQLLAATNLMSTMQLGYVFTGPVVLCLEVNVKLGIRLDISDEFRLLAPVQSC